MKPLSTVSTFVGVAVTALTAGIATGITPAQAAATTTAYDAAVLADSPKGYWPMDETTGKIKDLTGTHAAPSISTALLGTKGAVGNAASFDGIGQQIRVPYAASMRAASSFTAEVWAKLPATPQTTGWPTIFSRGQVTTGHFGTAMWVSSDSAHTVHFKRNGIDIGTTRGLNSSNYSHLVFTFNGTDKRWNWYVDGTLDKTGTTAGLAGTDAESLPLEIGAMLNSANGNPVNPGKLLVDGLAMYPKVLTAARVSAHYTAAKGAVAPPASTVTPPPATTPAGKHIGGVALGAGMPWNDRRAADFQAVSAANATYIRSDLGWQYLEPIKGDWRWDTFDRVITDARANNLRYLAILHTVPGWANGNAGDYGPAADTALLNNYCYQTAKHYIPMGVMDYEVGNEINLPHPGLSTPNGAAYARTTLIPCVAGVRKAASELGTKANIVFGALAPTDWTGGADPFTYLSDAYANGAKGLLDAVGWHPYTGSYTPAGSSHMNQDSQKLYDIMSANGDAADKLWATEYGLPTGGSNSFTEARQASDLTEAYDVWYAKPFAGPMFYYSARDTGTSATDREQHFGVLRFDGSAKPAYAALKAAMVR
ncbi:hypothetical protein GCM10010435_50250 [Winogradskya consettensis]|uniref:LamG-like jellyroll fold domain-containing protein n=1 Tax=Winogradskya consettensis TaxID=113560 RepID=A0A919VZ76_9ACTN|nr:hypothetical protein [Actinoplanes consettensis]GIM80140.1 hypothetical protein Aco04nite_69150 [Actinoplanes consettensis]